MAPPHPCFRRSAVRVRWAALLVLPAVIGVVSGCGFSPHGRPRDAQRAAVSDSVGMMVATLSPKGEVVGSSRLDLCAMNQYNWKVKDEVKRSCTITLSRIVAAAGVEEALAHLREAVETTGCNEYGSVEKAIASVARITNEYREHVRWRESVARNPDAVSPLFGRLKDPGPFAARYLFLSCPPDRDVQVRLFSPQAPEIPYALGDGEGEGEGDVLVEHAPWPAEIAESMRQRREPVLVQVTVKGLYAEQPWSLWDRMTPL